MMLFNEISPQTVNGNEYSSAFVEFFKPMRAVPFFGDNYNTIVPLFIALIGFFTVFKFFGRLLARATKGLISIDVNENTPDKIAKGEKAVLAEWERRKRKLRQEEINTQRVTFIYYKFVIFLVFLSYINEFIPIFNIIYFHIFKAILKCFI